MLLLGRSHLRPHSLGGLYEKVFLGLELAWLLAAAAWIARAGDAVLAEPVAGGQSSGSRSRSSSGPISNPN